jgi:hypothetical protein
MAIPSYAYLKIKIPRPAGVITVEAKIQRALDYKQNHIELATTMVPAAELRELSLRESLILTNLAMPPSSGTFKAAEDAKAVQIDAKNPTNIVQIGASLNGLPLMQQGHICMESGRNVGHLLGGHRAHPQC